MGSMRRVGALVLVCAVFGCGSSGGGGPPVDSGATPDSATDTGTGSDAAPEASVEDASTGDASEGGPEDSGGAPEGGGLPLGSACTMASDCASGLCEPFEMQTIHLCTVACTAATQAMDCPVPPTAGTCTPNMYCKFN